MTDAQRSFGAALYRDGHLIGEVTEIGDIDIEQEVEDATSHESADRFREKIGTVFNAGSLSLSGNFLVGDSDGQIGLKTDMEASTLQDFELVFPPSITATFAFTALVTHWKVGSMPVDGKLTFDSELEISGKPVLSITASTGLTPPFFSTDVGDIVPTAAGTTYAYVVVIATTETTVTITPTATAGVITITANGSSQVVATGNPSSPITLGAAGSVVEATIRVQETGKVAKVYTLQLTREAP